MKHASAIVAAALVFLPMALVAAPSLPPSERFVYARTIGDKRDTVEVNSAFVDDKAGSYYALTTHSAEEDVVLRIDPVTFIASYTEVTTRGKDTTMRRVTTILENKAQPGSDEILVTGTESLTFALRSFPWGEKQKAKIGFLGFGGAGFRFDLNVAGKENVAVGDRKIECWKAQLSLGGIMGAFFGKTSLWYSVEYPHYLVRSEGASGGPGSPQSVLILQSYASGPAGE